MNCPYSKFLNSATPKINIFTRSSSFRTGKIGRVAAKIMTGFGCKVLAYDLQQHPECEKIGVEYVDLPELFGRSDIITLHCPLTPETYHLVNADAITYGRLRQRGSDIIEYYSDRARTDL